MTQMVYDPAKTSLIVGGFPVVGFAGDRIVVEFNEDEIETVMGTDGNGRHVKKLDKSGTVKVTLEAGSPSNATFETIRLAGIPVPILAKDFSSIATMFMASDAMIRKQPNMALGTKPGDLEWTFNFISGSMTHSPAKEY